MSNAFAFVLLSGRRAVSVAAGMAVVLMSTVGLASDRVEYVRDVKPILTARCYACHGALKQEGDLRLDTASFAIRGGDSGAAIQPGAAGESLLVAKIAATDEAERMPPEGKSLTAEQMAIIRRWIDQGAEAPADETPEADPRQHWAFQRPQRPPVPAIKNATENAAASATANTSGQASDNPIDAFLGWQRQQQGLVAVREVDKQLLVRRVYLDLIGLPPSPEQVEAFLSDTRPDAYPRLVDQLLASPHYGERWGRHWMDVWRYTDWYGLGAQLRYSQKHIWHWRDWIVESLNSDAGYDQMVRQMLAADELSPTDHDALRATGFLARNYFLFNRTTWLDNTIEHTSKALLGLTMNCTKCHDHKYDPISQHDYYRLRAIFEPHQVRLDPLPGQVDLEQNGLPRVFDAHPDEPTYLHVRGDDKLADTSQPISPGVPEVLAFEPLVIEPVALPAEAHNPALQPFVLQDHLRQVQERIDDARSQLDAARGQLAKLEQLAKLQQQADEAQLTSAGQTGDQPSGSDDTTAKGAGGGVFLKDDFSAARPDLWETGPGAWSYEQGHLKQSQTGMERAWLRSMKPHPRDFEATLAFRIVGGQQWKSVGLCFDVTGEREKLVYMSAVMPGSKVQISHKSGDQHVYPAGGKQDRPVEPGRRYELRIAVRGTLVNVSIDGQHALAFTLPVEREPGKLEVIAFDAAVEFLALTAKPLTPDVKLVAAAAPGAPAPGPMTIEQARAAVVVAEWTLTAAQQRPAVLTAAHAADTARAADSPPDDLSQRIAAAVAAERQWRLADAERALAAAEQKLLASAESARPQVMKEVEQARGQRDKLRLELSAAATANATADPAGTYTSLHASLKALEGPAESEADRRKPYATVSTGRRAALAGWLTDRRNPLTARVAVNHVWLRHFGQPLVDPVADFGRRTPQPPQHALLDWLAVEFMENDWSFKHLHRLMVTSQAYRLESSNASAPADTVQRDPGNQFYWRRAAVRMESQLIRDSLLSLAGVLDRRMGGPTVDPQKEDTVQRRSLYFTHSRDHRQPFLAMFDDADILACYRRSESIVPQQALTLANSRLAMSMARQLAEQIERRDTSLSDEQFVTSAFEIILCRGADQDELAACLEAMRQTGEVLSGRPPGEIARRARQNLVHALLNHNDFITIR